MLSIPTNSLKIHWLSGKGAKKQVKLLSSLYILIHTIQYGLIFDNNCRVNYLCLSMQGSSRIDVVTCNRCFRILGESGSKPSTCERLKIIALIISAIWMPKGSPVKKGNFLYVINEDSCRKTAGKGLAKKSR